MAFPTGWPPRPASGRRSVRVYIAGTATALFSDNAYLFSQVVGANTFLPTPYQAPGQPPTGPFGDRTRGGSPMGGGKIPQDAAVGRAPGTEEPPEPMLFAQTLRITNLGIGNFEFSFDGVHIHGFLFDGEMFEYRNRFEAGIAIRGFGGDTPDFRIEAW